MATCRERLSARHEREAIPTDCELESHIFSAYQLHRMLKAKQALFIGVAGHQAIGHGAPAACPSGEN